MSQELVIESSELVAKLREAKDQAYSERNQCVALLARMAQRLGYPVWTDKHDPADEDWETDWRNIVFIGLPTGQVSWHIHDSELPLFAGWVSPYSEKWDGHTTAEKYERMRWCRP